MTAIVGVMSGKGGVSKTTSSVCLGAAMSYFGRNTIVVDGNLSTPNVGLSLGVYGVPLSLHNVLKGECSVAEAVYTVSKGLRILPAGLSISDLYNVDVNRLKDAISGLRGLCDVVIVDSAAGLGSEAFSVLNAVDDVIIVSHPEVPALTDSLKTLKVARELGKRVKGVILTRAGFRNDVSTSDVEALMEAPVLGVVPEDKSVRKSLVLNEPVVFSHPYSKSAIAYKGITAELIGVDYKAERGFLRKIFS